MARIARQALCGTHRGERVWGAWDALRAVGGALPRFAYGAPVLKRGGDRARFARFARRGRGRCDVAWGASKTLFAAWRVASGFATDTSRAFGVRTRPRVARLAPLAVARGVALGARLAHARHGLRSRLADLALGAVADHNARARVARVALGASDRRVVVRRTRRAPKRVLRRKRSRSAPLADSDCRARVGVETRKLARGEPLRACGSRWKTR